MLRPRLPYGAGIVLSPCNSVHMALMRFAIDVIYLNKDDRVVKIVRNLKPYRVSLGGFHAHAAIELPAGTLTGRDVQLGDLLQMATQEGVAEGVESGT
jgi:uncharacterized protein